jgi:molecular chaperone DnaJ
MIKIKVVPHPVFRREGYDILGDVEITVPLAVLGGTVSVGTLHGDVTVSVAPGTNTGDRHKLAGQGINHLPPQATKKGDHYVHFKVVVPKTLTER